MSDGAETNQTAARERLGPITGEVEAALADLEQRDAVKRMWARDHTLWHDDPTEISDRLGWLESPGEMAGLVDELEAFAREAADSGAAHAVVLGMGGSSLFPEVVAKAMPKVTGGMALHVLDTTHPDAVARVAALADEGLLVVAASKSGTTIETTSALAHLWDKSGEASRFVAITDPGSELAGLARERGFRAVFENRPDIGGRFSALSHFGLVPAALHGADVGVLLDGAGAMLEACAAGAGSANPGLRLGAAMAAAARAGRDKLTLVVPPELEGFGDWVEQLVAESTGKHGTGILPVVGEPLGDPASYGNDRLFVVYGAPPGLLPLTEAGHPVIEVPACTPEDLGAEVVRWEVATALAGAVLGVNPFDQPDVASAKEATGRVLDAGLPDIATEPLGPLLDALGPGDYLAIQAFVDPGSPVVAELERVREILRARHRVATTLGIGPRYLHSTGQLHKGGPPRGVFVQVLDPGAADLDIPGRPYGFGTLFRAQAAGDLQALQHRGLRAGRVELAELLGVGR